MDQYKEIMSVVNETLETETSEINYNVGLEEAGINSITFMKIIIALEMQFDFEFDNEKIVIDQYGILRDLLDYVVSKISNN